MTAHKHPAAPVPASDCSPVSGAGTNLAKPWGNDTICPGCNRGKTYNCICDPFFEDDEQMPAEDVVRIMGQLYPGWSRVEL